MSGLYSAAFTAASKIYGGIQQKRADDRSAAMLSQEAGQSVASGIQGAIATRRQADYVASNARARIAGSGLTTTGLSAEDTVGNIEGEGDYRALTSLYQGSDRAQELDIRGQGLRNEGSASQTAGWIGGISTVLSDTSRNYDRSSSFYNNYGRDT